LRPLIASMVTLALNSRLWVVGAALAYLVTHLLGP